MGTELRIAGWCFVLRWFAGWRFASRLKGDGLDCSIIWSVNRFAGWVLLFCAATLSFMPHASHAANPDSTLDNLTLPYVDWLLPPTMTDDEEELTVLINPRHLELWIMIGNVPVKRYPIALGKMQTPTPVGEFQVINKYKNWGSGFGTRWIGLNIPWGTYGIHGTNKPHSIGTHASHGCIRMFNHHVEQIYEWVEVGTRVVILGHVLRGPDMDPRDLAKGDAGGDVMLVQNRLQHAGYYKGVCHGRFDDATEQAVKQYEREHRLPVDGVINGHDYLSLGLVE